MVGGKKNFLNEELKNQVVEMITNFESKSSIEFVPCFIEQSSEYQEIRLTASLVLSVALSALISFLIPWSLDHYWYGLIAMVLTFTIFYFFVSWHILKLPIKEIQLQIKEKVKNKAIIAFFDHKINQHAEGKGLLFYVSKLEKRFYLLPDSALLKKLDHSFWDKQIENLEVKIQQKSLQEGILEFLKEILTELEKIFPQDNNKDNKNQIENVWIDLKK